MDSETPRLISALLSLVATSAAEDFVEAAWSVIAQDDQSAYCLWEADEVSELVTRRFCSGDADSPPADAVTVERQIGARRHCLVLSQNAGQGIGGPETLADWLLQIDLLASRLALNEVQARASLPSDRLGTAIVSTHGSIEFADATFREQLDLEDGATTLPFAPHWDSRVAKHGFVWEAMFFRISPVHDRYLLLGRPDRRRNQLTRREYDVVSLVAQGMTFKQIGRELDMAASTASSHVYKAYEKLDISRRSDLVKWLEQERRTY